MWHYKATIWPYLDDIARLANSLATATEHFHQLRQLLNDLGLQEAKHKAVLPTRAMTWVGIHFDLDTMTMSIPQDKLTETANRVHFWLSQQTISKRQLQSLTGSLAHITMCCPAGRLFTSRLYNLLATQPDHQFLHFTDGARLDLLWFAAALHDFSGVRLLRQQTTLTTLTTDSCLTGGGATTGTAFYAIQYTPELLDKKLPIRS